MIYSFRPAEKNPMVNFEWSVPLRTTSLLETVRNSEVILKLIADGHSCSYEKLIREKVVQETCIKVAYSTPNHPSSSYKKHGG